MRNEVKYNILDFILGGKSDFTIFQEPDIQVKYRIVSSDNGNVWFIYTQTKGSKKVSYQGYFTKSVPYTFKESKNTIEEVNTRAIKGLMWVLNHANSLPSTVHVLHHGKCSICGRQLKDADSLASGLGPVCRKKARR